MLKEQLTLITPVRITNQIHASNFLQTIESYYRLFGEDRPRHLLASATLHDVFNAVQVSTMDRVNPDNWEDVSHNTRPIQALNDLVRAVRTPYVHIVLADVCAVGDKNFLQLGIDAMEFDKDICQMRYSDDPLSCAKPTNLSPFESDGEKVFFVGMPQHPFDGLVMADMDKSLEDSPNAKVVSVNTVWRYPMAAAAQKRWMGFAFWPCTYRTDVLRRVVDEAERRMDTQQPQWAGTLAGWMSVINRTADMGGWCLPEKGWPEGFEFLEPLKQGTLNMASYMFALGREQKSWEDFMKTSTLEMKSVPGWQDSTWGEPHVK